MNISGFIILLIHVWQFWHCKILIDTLWNIILWCSEWRSRIFEFPPWKLHPLIMLQLIYDENASLDSISNLLLSALSASNANQIDINNSATGNNTFNVLQPTNLPLKSRKTHQSQFYKPKMIPYQNEKSIILKLYFQLC